mmetsp:Transcript_52464/g.131963  ORF Transcript_52464/g.131963 Transcript_52464/m.131963 type:complete len:342 (-) Transcript_52464:1563-2588(-)
MSYSTHHAQSESACRICLPSAPDPGAHMAAAHQPQLPFMSPPNGKNMPGKSKGWRGGWPSSCCRVRRGLERSGSSLDLSFGSSTTNRPFSYVASIACMSTLAGMRYVSEKRPKRPTHTRCTMASRWSGVASMPCSSSNPSRCARMARCSSGVGRRAPVRRSTVPSFSTDTLGASAMWGMYAAMLYANGVSATSNLGLKGTPSYTLFQSVLSSLPLSASRSALGEGLGEGCVAAGVSFSTKLRTMSCRLPAFSRACSIAAIFLAFSGCSFRPLRRRSSVSRSSSVVFIAASWSPISCDASRPGMMRMPSPTLAAAAFSACFSACFSAFAGAGGGGGASEMEI